jgi:hypothetical protein
MPRLLICLVFVSFPASAEMFKCFDGVHPKYTYQNMPCENTGLKTAKIITNKDALVGSADFSGYQREAKERAALSRALAQGDIERRNPEYARAEENQGKDNGCATLLAEKRRILSMQRQDSTAALHERYAENRKRMQAINCQGA